MPLQQDSDYSVSTLFHQRHGVFLQDSRRYRPDVDLSFLYQPDARIKGEEGHFEIFSYRLAKYVAALTVPLGRLDALIFTGGIGEHDAGTRARVIELLAHMHFELDPERNSKHGRESRGIITRDGTTVAMVVATNEELLIASDTAALIAGKA